jgi:hypothetical protein
MPVNDLSLAPFYGTSRNPQNYAKFEQVSRDIATQWLNLDAIRDQLNLFNDTSQDDYLSDLDLATRMIIEDFLGMAVFSTQYRVYYSNLGLYNTAVYLDLPETGIGSAGVTINAVEFYGSSSNTVPIVINPATYSYDPTGNQIILNQVPNTLNQDVANPIVALYTCNANPMANYPVIQQAGLMLLTHLYNNRSTTNVNTLKQIPFGVEALLRPYKPLVM